MRLEVPGRLCLFGEHADWAGGYRSVRRELPRGYCLVSGTDQAIAAEVERLDGLLEISSVDPEGRVRGPLRIPSDPRALAAAACAGGFFSYALGTAAEVLSRHRAGGLRVSVVRADLPVRKGLSSSAAICVLVARAFGALYELGLSTREEMELAYLGERRAGSECGRMDQICALGRRASYLTFDGEDLEIELLEPAAPLSVLVVDLGRSKDTRRILADLNRCFPDASGAVAAGVRDALGPRNVEILKRARNALLRGDPATIGELMTEAQGVFDRLVAPACPELRAPRLHEVLAHPAAKELAFGGKGVGSQGDGCAQLVANGPEEREALAARLERDLGVACFPVTVRAVGISSDAVP
jgi:galactokinase